LGGLIADLAGYQTTFMLSAMGGVLTALLLIFLVKNPLAENPPIRTFLTEAE